MKIIIQGPQGCGKTQLAAKLAKLPELKGFKIIDDGEELPRGDGRRGCAKVPDKCIVTTTREVRI